MTNRQLTKNQITNQNKNAEKIKEIYQNIGYTVIETIAKEQENNLSGIQELKKYLNRKELNNKVSV